MLGGSGCRIGIVECGDALFTSVPPGCADSRIGERLADKAMTSATWAGVIMEGSAPGECMAAMICRRDELRESPDGGLSESGPHGTRPSG